MKLHDVFAYYSSVRVVVWYYIVNKFD